MTGIPRVEFSYLCNASAVIAATGLAPNEVHLGRLPRPPLTSFEHAGVAGQCRIMPGNQPGYCDLVTGRRPRSHDIVRDQHMPSQFIAWTTETPPFPALWTRFSIYPSLVIGRGYTIRPQRPTEACEGRHRSEIPQGQTFAQLDGPLQNSCDWPRDLPVRHRTVSLLELSSSVWVSALRHAQRGCTPPRIRGALQVLSQPPRQSNDFSKYKHSQEGLTQYALQNFTVKPLPYQVTDDEVSKRIGDSHRSSTGPRSRGCHRNAVRVYGAHWTELFRPFCVWEMEPRALSFTDVFDV